MQINLIRLVNKSLIKDSSLNDELIDDLNEQLFDEEIILAPGVKDSLIDVILVESSGVIDQFSKIVDRLNHFVYLICFNTYNSLSDALVINNYLSRNHYSVLLDDHPLHSLKEILPTYIDSARTVKEGKGKNFGVFISSDENKVVSKFDEGKLYSKFGISIVRIGNEELKTEYKRNKNGNIPHLIKLKKMVRNQKALDKTLAMYSAISI